MRDYTSNNFCDFLWIGDLLELKQNDRREFILETNISGKSAKLNISNVIIFGTIVEVKQVGNSGFLYHVDDGTGVITCKHSEEQFQELILAVEAEQVDVNQTFECSMSDTSANDSIFNDRSMQLDEINFYKKSRLIGLQSIWNDLYKSFHSLIEPYSIGDTVIIEGKLYSYIHVNQIYINSIRALGIEEEIIHISVKLEDGLDKSKEKEASKPNRMSGLLTFDNIPQLSPDVTLLRNVKSPEVSEELFRRSSVVTPNLKSTLTFDTFDSMR